MLSTLQEYYIIYIASFVSKCGALKTTLYRLKLAQYLKFSYNHYGKFKEIIDKNRARYSYATKRNIKSAEQLEKFLSTLERIFLSYLAKWNIIGEPGFFSQINIIKKKKK